VSKDAIDKGLHCWLPPAASCGLGETAKRRRKSQAVTDTSLFPQSRGLIYDLGDAPVQRQRDNRGSR
jgi:hypothetical protein